jgi:hypothetical protein
MFRVEIPGYRPAVDRAGGCHCGVFARAVLGQLRRFAAGAEPVLPFRVPVGQINRILKRRFGEAVQLEDAHRPVLVLTGAGVARRGQRQQVRRQVQAGTDQGHGLQRLERGARVEQR